MRKMFLFLVVFAFFAVSCGDTKGPQIVEQSAYPVLTVDTSSALIHLDFAAELQSAQVVEIRPRVSGYIDRVAVREGARVRKGELLFKVNPDDLYEQLNAARAIVDGANATADNAKLEVQKLTPLVEKGIISPYELQNANSSFAAAVAQLNATKSQARNAQISLNYTNIVSPVNGFIGRIVVRAGTLVTPTETEPLTTVSSDGPMSAYFSINENMLLNMVSKGITLGKDTGDLIELMPKVSLVLSNGEIYDKKGTVEMASGLIDMTTGSLRLKAIFSNKDFLLRSGASAKVRINSPHSGVIVIPQSATFELQNKVLVYKVSKSGEISSQVVETYGKSGTNYVLKSGLEPGDTIVLEGINLIREGSVIKTKTVE